MMYSVRRTILRTSGTRGDSPTSGGCRTDTSAFVVGACRVCQGVSFAGWHRDSINHLSVIKFHRLTSVLEATPGRRVRSILGTLGPPRLTTGVRQLKLALPSRF